MALAAEITTLTVGRWAVNCYLVHDGATGLIVDPGDEAEMIIRRVEALGFVPLAIVNTHAHFDHVGAVASVKERFDIPFHLHPGDKRLLTHANLYRRLAGDATIRETPAVDVFLGESSHLQIAAWRIDVLHTPGHTNGSVCLRVGGALFSGDTIFCTGVGRTDLPGGSTVLLQTSLDLLKGEPAELELFPGHGPSGRLGPALATLETARDT